MKKKSLMSIAAIVLILCSCNQLSEKATESTAMTQNEKVKKTIDDLGLVYVEEGAQDIITYDEVNAQRRRGRLQSFC